MSSPLEPPPLTVLVRRRLAELRRLLRQGDGKSAREMLALVPHFFKNAPEAFALGYRACDLLALLSRAYRVILLSRGEKVVVSVFNPEETLHGFSSERTVIQISAPDGPFYVNSVRAHLRSMKHSVVHLIHPILPAAWDSRGRLTRLGDAQLSARQSLIHIEIDRVEDRVELARIDRAVRQVFADIHAAVRDYPKIRLVLQQTRSELEKIAAPNSSDIQKLAQFLKWLDTGNFVFLGYREYVVLAGSGERAYAVRRGSGLGLMRNEKMSKFYKPVPMKRLPSPQRTAVMGKSRFLITQTNRPSPIYRRERMADLQIQKTDARGRTIGIHRWIGLFTNRVEGIPPTEIPIIREKFEQVVKAEGAEEHSHNYREIHGIFSSYPKDFLFSTSAEDLRRDIRAALVAQSSREFKATFRPATFGNGISVMVILSKDKFSREGRLKIEDLLRRRLAASEINYSLSMGAEGAEFARLYFECVTERKTPVQGGFADLERELAAVAKNWPDRLLEELIGRLGPKCAMSLFKLYGGAFSVEFYSHTPPAGAVHDIARLEALYTGAPRSEGSYCNIATSPIQIDIFNSKLDADCSRLKLYHLHEKLLLSDVMPILTDHGLRVVDEVSNSVRVSGRPISFIHTFRIQENGKPMSETSALGASETLTRPIDVGRLGASLSESIRSGILRERECDPLCSLILYANLSPRQVELVRMFRNYLHQIVPVHTLRSIDGALIQNPFAARLLVDLFMARFNPVLGSPHSSGRRKKVSDLEAAFEEAMDRVDDLVEDRVLRLMADAIGATVRTNYFQTPARRTLGVKIQCDRFDAMPRPAPLFEIFVFDRGFEGIHMRSGSISRGGIRHSDRRDDYRTEILGLMKTQMAKNAIIVPDGAKGGFVVKMAGEKITTRKTALACYRNFIRTLLDLTDNIIGQRVVHPVGCVIYDAPDPYFVVAADKGTADFSDSANEISMEAGYWLGDAFASGGKNGYDHKKLGITARGTWECVRHHLETVPGPTGAGKGTLPVTCAGIGDMAGDVFGNGMILAPKMRVGHRPVTLHLKAAFNHEHVFLDPYPGPAAAAERLRLFHLPRSSWADYRRSAISSGGGVYLRRAKKITVSAAAARMLGLASRTASGEDMVRAILKMKVDLLYNGGIGTYVKAAEEHHVDVGDPSNDRVRVNASELRCQIVGEGGNMGFTQLARIEFAAAGGRINTDAVDNSAGVDLSDHEVNLKILLDALKVKANRRDFLLRRITGSVCKLVLRDNADQSRILSMEERRSIREMDYYPHLIDILCTSAGLSSELEKLPTDKVLAERAKEARGLLRPELAVVMAYVKMCIERSILECADWRGGAKGLAADPILGPFLPGYFPGKIARAFGTKLMRHRLADRIISNWAANAFVNTAGFTLAFRLSEECGVTVSCAVRAYFVAVSLVGAAGIRSRISSWEASETLEDGLAAVARWLLKEYAQDLPSAMDRFADLTSLFPRLLSLLSDSEKKDFERCVRRLKDSGVSPSLAGTLAEVRMAFRLLELQVASARLQTVASKRSRARVC